MSDASSRSRHSTLACSTSASALETAVSRTDPGEPAVPSNNPCPFLRALVAGGHLAGQVEQLSKIADTIVAAGGGSATEPQLPRSKVYLRITQRLIHEE